MSLYLHKKVTPDVVIEAKKAGIMGIKSYPHGVTTHSDQGVLSYEEFFPVFEEMQRQDMVLNIHGEVPSSAREDITVLNAEESFLPTFFDIHRRFPALRIILEHCTSAAAVEAVKSCGPTVAGTITAHHLFMVVDDWAGDPHCFCKPVAKLPSDRRALLRAVMSGDPKFFLGTDSAPHPADSKRADKFAAGVFTQPFAVGLVIDALEEAIEMGVLQPDDITHEKLVGFLSDYGRAFYGLPKEEKEKIVLKKCGSSIPNVLTSEDGDFEVVPFRRGKVGWGIEWSDGVSNADKEGVSTSENKSKVDDDGKQAIEKGIRIIEDGIKVIESGISFAQDKSRGDEKGSQARENGSKVEENGSEARDDPPKADPDIRNTDDDASKAHAEESKDDESAKKLVENGTLIDDSGLNTEENGSKADAEGLTTELAGSKIEENGAMSHENGSKAEEDGSAITENGVKADEDEREVQIAGSKVDEDGSQAEGDASAIRENGLKADEGEGEVQIAGSKVDEDGSKAEEDGSAVKENGVKADEVSPGSQVVESKITENPSTVEVAGSQVDEATPNGAKGGLDVDGGVPNADEKESKISENGLPPAPRPES